MRREPFGKNCLLGIWQREERPIEYYLALLDNKKSEDNPPELGISALKNGQIESIHTNRLETLLRHHSKEELSIASFCPNLTASQNATACFPIIHTMPPYSNAHRSVACIGTIQNIEILWEGILPDGYQFLENSAEEILGGFIDIYLERTDLSPIQIIHILTERLRGNFVLMTLFSREEKGLIVIARRDYPLVFGRNSRTIFFSTDPEVLALFCPSINFLEENVITSCDSSEPSLRSHIFPYTD